MAETAAAAPKTPWHVWLLGVLLTLWGGFGAFDFAATLARFEPWVSSFPPEMVAYVYAAPWWMYAFWGAGTWGGLAGGLALLLRNKLAVPALVISVLGAVGSFAMCFIDPPPHSNPVFSAAIVGVSALFLGYALWLSRRGVMR